MIHLAYLGNHSAEHSTESHVARAWEANGHRVTRLQEARGVWHGIWDLCAADPPDLFLWTRTGSYDQDPPDFKLATLDMLANADVPTVAYHLDRWWGLDREGQVESEPFFRCAHVLTADGGHDDLWAKAGVNHTWFPPGVSETECELGQRQRRFVSDVAFVGSWRSYHPEWEHRQELVRWLRRRQRSKVRFWPERNQPAVRGVALRDLYASVKVLVGDSCLVGDASRYWSDRIPETLGRGGFLIHPNVDGLGDHFTPGHHLATWDLGDWDTLGDLVDHYLRNDEERRAIAAAGREHVLLHHTYEVRVRQVLDLLGMTEQREAA